MADEQFIPVGRNAREEPPFVRQLTDITCWAAALESWLAVTKSPVHRQADLLRAFRDRGFDVNEFRPWALERHAMRTMWVEKRDFNVISVNQWLEESALFVAYPLSPAPRPPEPDTWWHAVVLYHITAKPEYVVMDPGRTQATSRDAWTKSDFFAKSLGRKILVGLKLRPRVRKASDKPAKRPRNRAPADSRAREDRGVED